MKKKIISILLVLVLVCGLSISALAVDTTQKPALAAGEKLAKTGDPAEVKALMTTVMTNRATILSLKSSNLTLAVQLKTILNELKSSGAAVPEETLNQLKDCKNQLKVIHQQLKDTVGQLDPLMATFKEYQRARDFENAAAALQQVIAIQQTRITLETQIGTLTQQMIDIVNTISTAA